MDQVIYDNDDDNDDDDYDDDDDDDNVPSNQISSNACKMVMVTLKAAQCKILKVNIDRKNTKR